MSYSYRDIPSFEKMEASYTAFRRIREEFIRNGLEQEAREVAQKECAEKLQAKETDS